jgi:hypothetical protein
VKVILEVEGQLLSQPADQDEEPKSHELKAKGQFLYEERLASGLPRQALRYYEQAQADLSVDGRPNQATLRADRRLIAVDALDDPDVDTTFRSLQGPLTREELELIELPGGSHVADQLLPERAVRVGESWSHADALLAKFLNLSAVTANQVTSQLLSVDRQQQVAQLAINGSLVGAVGGVISEIQLQGKYRFDLRSRRVSWLALGIHEQREPGLAKPGLRVRARVRMLVEPAQPQHLAADAVQAIVATAPQPTDLLEYQSPDGRFALMYDRRWHLFAERPDLTVLRMIEDGQLIAQCNLRALSRPEQPKGLTLAEFQQEIRAALGKSAEQVVDSSESELPNGVHQLRVAVAGQVANAPIHWIYYHLSDGSGPSLTCAFTMSGADVERFAAQDVSFVSNLTLAPAQDRSATPRAALVPPEPPPR